MRILLEVFDSDTRIGATNDALDLARYGRLGGLEYLISGPIKDNLLQEANKLGIKTINYRSRQFSRIGIAQYYYSVVKWIFLLLRNRPDIVHINYTAWGPSLACAARILRIPIVLRAGSPYDPRNLTFRWVDRYVANCEAQASGLLDSPLGNRVAVVGDLVNMDRGGESKEERLFTEARDGAVKLLFLGQLVERKGIDVLVKALSKVNANYILYLVGGDWEQPGYPQDIKRLIGERGLGDRVFVHNHRTDALALLTECDVFVLPSLSEARPRSIIEAMLVGKCVVSTNAGGIPTLIENGVDGFLAQPGDVDDLASVLQIIMDDPARRKHIAESARIRASNMFSIRATIERYKNVYESLI